MLPMDWSDNVNNVIHGLIRNMAKGYKRILAIKLKWNSIAYRIFQNIR